MSTILTVAPADLTQIRKQNNGEFPFWRVYKIIDGVTWYGDTEPVVCQSGERAFSARRGAATLMRTG
jgi:hypothetical protein